MIYRKGCRYLLRGFTAYRIDNAQRCRARGAKRACWVQQGTGPWKLRSVYDGGVRRLGWEMHAMLQARAERHAGGMFDHYEAQSAKQRAKIKQREELIECAVFTLADEQVWTVRDGAPRELLRMVGKVSHRLTEAEAEIARLRAKLREGQQ